MNKTRALFFKILEYSGTFFIIVTATFFIARALPGDPFLFLSAEEGVNTSLYSESHINYYRSYYGLNRSLPCQYISYIYNLFVKGDFGYSIYYKESVLQIIHKRVWWTLGIVVVSMLLSVAGGIILGSISAWNRNRAIDTALYTMLTFISEIPGFLFGIVFLFLLAGQLQVFPLCGGFTPFAIYSSWFDKAKDIAHHAVLPILTLSLSRLGGFYFLSRNSILTVITKDYIRTAHAKGLGLLRIIFIHTLKNAIAPIITRVFTSLGTLFGGAVIIENVFNYPGLGCLIRDSVFVRDYPLLQGIFLFITFLVLLFNFTSDIFIRKTDKRITL